MSRKKRSFGKAFARRAIFFSTVAMIVLVAIYLIAPQLLLTEALELTNTFFFIFLAVPFMYIVAIIVYAMRKARHRC